MRLERQFSLHSNLLAFYLKAFLLAAVAYPLLAPAQSTDIDEKAQHWMETQVAYEKMQPKGMAIEAKEISRTGNSGQDLVVNYHVIIKGAKANAAFQEIDWPITADQPSNSLVGIAAGADGTLICPKTAAHCGDANQPGDPITFVTHPKPGEPTRLAFESQGVKIGLVIVPDPIESKDKLCTLNAVRLTPKFEVAYITGSGYPANSDVHYKVMPLSDQDFVVKADAAGTIRTVVVPQTAGNASLSIKVEVDEAACAPVVSYVFGG